jgi:hypothetical protein
MATNSPAGFKVAATGKRVFGVIIRVLDREKNIEFIAPIKVQASRFGMCRPHILALKANVESPPRHRGKMALYGGATVPRASSPPGSTPRAPRII